jgi:hypothetical protein
MIDDDLIPPGPTLRDPAYQDLCAFFATFPPGQAWQPRAGDWVSRPPLTQPRLVIAADGDSLRLAGVPEGQAEEADRAGWLWLPTLDQLRQMMLVQFGTSGFFSSAFNGASYWYSGQMLGMTVTNMQPLAEGDSPEEAALKALLMLHQR